MKKRLILMIVVGGLTLAADQTTKIIAKSKLADCSSGRCVADGKPVIVIDDYLAFEYHENPGIAFGIGRNLPAGRYILTAIGIIALFMVWRVVKQVEERRRIADFAFGLVAGGAIGNLIDRIYIGRVIDFIVMHWQRKATWPAYNVSDAALVVGVILLVFSLGKRQEMKKAKRKGKA